MKILRNTKTNEIYPLNPDMMLHDDVEVVDVPNLKKATLRRGVAILEDQPIRRGGRSKQIKPPEDDGAPADPPPAPEPEGGADGDDPQ